MRDKITISGECVTGKSAIGRFLAQWLNYEFYSVGGFIRDKIKPGTGLVRCDEIRKIALSKGLSHYDLEADRRSAEYGLTKSNFVFEGRLAWRFIPDSTKILFTCPIEPRIHRLRQAKLEYDYDAAAWKIWERDIADRKRFARAIDVEEPGYGIENYLDPAYYDFCVDTSRYPSAEVAARYLYDRLVNLVA